MNEVFIFVDVKNRVFLFLSPILQRMRHILSETNEKPADLSEKIIFKSKKDGDRKREGESSTEDPKDVKKKKKEQQKERQQSKNKLSFGDDDEEEEE